jgi:Na+/phosphate symporter
VRWFAELLHLLPGSDAMQLTHGHLIFNVVTVVIVLLLFTPFRRVLERWIPDDAPVVVR